MSLGVVEKILLHDPGSGAVPLKGAPALIFLPDDLLDPGIHRGAGGPAIGEQRHTAGYFHSDAPHAFQGGGQFVIGKGGDPGQVQIARQDLPYRVAEIRRPVPGFAGYVVLRARIFICGAVGKV